MTTYRMYRCNLCSDYLKPTDAAAKDGFGVHHTWNKQQPIVFKPVHDTERHICLSCAKGVHDEFRKVMPAVIKSGSDDPDPSIEDHPF